MDLTVENKTCIDNLTYRELLSGRRLASVRDKWFQGETGDYWRERMEELRRKLEGKNEQRKLDSR